MYPFSLADLFQISLCCSENKLSFIHAGFPPDIKEVCTLDQDIKGADNLLKSAGLCQMNTLVRIGFGSYYIKENHEFGKFCLQGLLPFTGLRQNQLPSIFNKPNSQADFSSLGISATFNFFFKK